MCDTILATDPGRDKSRRAAAEGAVPADADGVKPKLQAVGECMRKLVMLCSGVPKTRTEPHDPGLLIPLVQVREQGVGKHVQQRGVPEPALPLLDPVAGERFQPAAGALCEVAEPGLPQPDAAGELARPEVVTVRPLVPLRRRPAGTRRAEPPHEVHEPPDRLHDGLAIADLDSDTHLRASYPADAMPVK